MATGCDYSGINTNGVIDMKKLPLDEKSVEELVREANELLKNSIGEMTEEEEIEDDAEGGYFQQDGDD